MIFPGGCLPSLAEIRRSAARATDMRILEVDDIAGATRRRSAAGARTGWRRADGLAVGADRRFRRLFEFYFAWCEGGFTERRIGDVQALLAKPSYRGSGSPLQRTKVLVRT